MLLFFFAIPGYTSFGLEKVITIYTSSKGETMSDRRRRSEASWNKKENKSLSRWSNSDVNDDMIPGNHSGRSSWDPLQGNKNRPKGDDISRDRHRMLTDPNIDEWGKQYSTRPSDDCYDLSYRLFFTSLIFMQVKHV